MKKIKYTAYLIPVILVFIVVTGVYYRHYENTVEIIKSEYGAKMELVEQSIYNETKYTETVSKMAERDIDYKMEEKSKIIAGYYKQNPHVLKWDMDGISKRLDGMEIYILDKDLNVVTSSQEEEIGMNFSAYPNYSVKLKERLAGNAFESDDIKFSILEAELRKYSYMPTADNEYLIELSVTVEDIYPELKSLNIVHLSKDLESQYEFVEEIGVYKYNRREHTSQDLSAGNKILDEYAELTTDRNQFIRKALETKVIQQYGKIDKEGHSYTIKYIPYAAYYQDDPLTWWRSYVIEIIYNDQIVIEALSHQKKMFLQSIAIIALLYFSLAFAIMYLLQQNRRTAYQDHLTKLPNRKRFEEEMKYKIAAANKNGTKIAILFLDLDKFKEVNDTYGHNFGDKVLQEVASRIRSIIPKGDMVSRLGGDEFTALVTNIGSLEEITEIGEKMVDAFVTKASIDLEEIYIKPSIGISVYPDNGQTLEELIFNADIAMYEAKEKQLQYKIF